MAQTKSKITAVSMYRYRADAAMQRRLGLKVGGTMTEFSVSDGSQDMTIEAWGATPGERATAAKACFELSRGDGPIENYSGQNCAARVKHRYPVRITLEQQWRSEQNNG